MSGSVFHYFALPRISGLMRLTKYSLSIWPPRKGKAWGGHTWPLQLGLLSRFCETLWQWRQLMTFFPSLLFIFYIILSTSFIFPILHVLNSCSFPPILDLALLCTQKSGLGQFLILKAKLLHALILNKSFFFSSLLKEHSLFLVRTVGRFGKKAKPVEI